MRGAGTPPACVEPGVASPAALSRSGERGPNPRTAAALPRSALVRPSACSGIAAQAVRAPSPIWTVGGATRANETPTMESAGIAAIARIPGV